MYSETRVGIGFDLHRLKEAEQSENNTIPLGGIRIPYYKSFEAHSDGDVVIHAIVDALLGALKLGDIGMHFPPTDPKYQGMNSDVFLRATIDMVKTKNAKINNIDVIIIAEKPKILPHMNRIAENLANIMNISSDRVSIKAKTAEKLGYIGREEAIAVQAIAAVVIPA